ncbi:hypothetical protein KKF04_03965, partial [Patescibacteria group bacterium]|nr:hypothetical protein [Patescibacteria group bacterium]
MPSAEETTTQTQENQAPETTEEFRQELDILSDLPIGHEERMQKVGEVLVLDNFLTAAGDVDMEKARQLASRIPAEVLYQLEDEMPGTLLKIFATRNAEKYIFNFRGNNEAEAVIGLNVFFKYQPEVRALHCLASDGDEKNGVRRGLTGNFYDGNEYVEVMDNYIVTVTERYGEDDFRMVEMREKRQQALAEFEQNKLEERFNGFYEMLEDERYSEISLAHIDYGENNIDKLTYLIFDESINANVDPYLVMALLKTENGQEGKFFGVMIEEAFNFEGQLDWAIKLIQKHELGYQIYSGAEPRNMEGIYTIEFLAYFSERYSPSSLNPNHFNNLHRIYYSYRDAPLPENVAELRNRGRMQAKENKEYDFEATQLTDEQIAYINEHIEGLPPNERTIMVARILADPEYNLYMGTDTVAGHCGKWVGWVYSLAGVDKNTIYRDMSYRKGHENARCGDIHASEEQMDDMQPGDWLWINRPSGINHSVLFLGWNGALGDRMAITANLRRGKTIPADVTTFSLKESPVVNIYRP